MYIMLEPSEITLKELIEDSNKSCGVLSYKDECKNRTNLLFINKVSSTDNLNIVTYCNLYHSDLTEIIQNLDYMNDNVLLAYDTDINIILVDDYVNISHSSYINLLKEQFNDYTLVNYSDMFDEINKYYCNKLNELLDSKFQELMKIKEYSLVYDNTINNDINRVEIDYINKDTNYNIDVEMPEKFRICPLNTVHTFVKNTAVIDKSISDLGKSMLNNQYYLTTHATNMARKHLLKLVIANPSQALLNTLKIRESIDIEGKTLTVTLEDNSVCKVRNNLINGRYFLSTKGYNQVPIDKIVKITFGRNTLYTREKQ